MKEFNKLVGMYEKKASMANYVVETVKKDAKEVFDLLEKAQNESIDVIEKLDEFLFKQELLKDEKYIIDGNEFDIREELLEYFEAYEDLIDEISNSSVSGDYFFSPEKEMLEWFTWDLDIYVLYARFVKWSLTGDDDDLEMFLEILNDEFIEGYLCPVDRTEYWRKEYDQFDNLGLDGRLVEWVVYINRFFDVYSEYIDIYLKNRDESDRVELVEASEAWDTDAISAKIRIIEDHAPYDPWFMKAVYNNPEKKMDLWKQLMNGVYFDKLYCPQRKTTDDIQDIPEEFRFIIELTCGTEKHKKYWKKCELSSEEYFLLTRNLSEQEQFDTGRIAYWILLQNIETINITKWVLKVLGKTNSDYLMLYKSITSVQDKLIYLVYGNRYEYEIESISELAATNGIEQYKKQCIMEMTTRLLGYIANRNIDELMQCKKDIMPLCQAITPWLSETVEKNILQIVEYIKISALEEAEFNKVIDDISVRYAEILPADIIKTLATAEYLYDIYISNNDPVENYDYSFISILYYQVLEKALNIFIYHDYLKHIESEVDAANYKTYFGEAVCGKVYKDKRRNCNKYKAKDSLELGPMSFLIRELQKDESAFCEFLKSKYPSIEIEKLIKLGAEIGSASKRRNDAAHPGVITYEVAKEDKSIVYEDESYTEARELHDLFIRLISILGFGEV